MELLSTRIKDLSVYVHLPPGGTVCRGTLMFLHGAWIGGWIWRDFADYFAMKGYRCFVPTWRGHYNSRPVVDLGSLSISDYVEDALTVAEEASPDVLVGESMGGLVAQKLAESDPRLKGLVLMNPAPPFRVPLSPRVVVSQVRYLKDLVLSRPNHPAYDDYRRLILNTMEEGDARDFYDKICPESGRALREMSLGRIKVDAEKIKCPVYVVAGRLDPLLPPRVHRRIAARYGARLKEYPHMSHHTFSEPGWIRVALELSEWLEERLALAV